MRYQVPYLTLCWAFAEPQVLHETHTVALLKVIIIFLKATTLLKVITSLKDTTFLKVKHNATFFPAVIEKMN